MTLAPEPVVAETAAEVRLGGLAHSLGFLLRIAQVRNYERFYARFEGMDLRPGEFSVLWVIQLNPGIRQGLLAQTLSIKPAQMTKVIRRLEEQGKLVRTIPEGDRRSVRLDLSEAGRAFVEARRDDFLGADDYHGDDLTPEESRELARLLLKYSGTSFRDTE
ncbi:MarR family winged helix-turn-helix transcriptional regulator [Tranquillimonas alkanivorans]|uniref:Transcriptional regulator, MarR family n=1 Tax=Tranquillimonas alkanivorans TaxID=441119 RepID=A0A1I5Q1K8_9RHOB|nr:MarR family transcriptional regulator [Tranquillimonas alkanivorans]SFP40077.1 transcriptional regulator, MarR family [Tranquillimonas alkanivorans]